MRQTTMADLNLPEADQAIIRIWDGDWNLQHTLEGFTPENYGEWRRFTIPVDHPAVAWFKERASAFTHFTIDQQNQRWHGVLNQWEQKQNPCPTCQHGRMPGLIVTCEPAVVVPSRVMEYQSKLS